MNGLNRRRLVWLIVGGTAAILAVTLVSSVVLSAVKSSQVRDTQVTYTATLDNTERTLQIIEDCTTPGGKCYERSLERTKNVVNDITRVSVYAAACADRDGVQGEDEIFACVVHSLARDAAKP